MSKFIDRVKEGIGILQPKNYLNPKLNTSQNRMFKIKQRNQKVQKAQKELADAKKKYQFWQSMQKSKFVTTEKAPELYKYEQNLKKVLKENPSIK